MSESADEKRTRRRWINLAELVAVAGLVIAALSFWLNYAERRDARRDRATEVSDKARFELHGAVASGNRAIMLTRDDTHELRDVRVSFPTTLGVPPRDAIDFRIDSDWVAEPLLKLTDHGPDHQVGRLPVLVTYSYSTGDDEFKRTAIYDIVWDTGGRFLRGRRFAFSGFHLNRRGGDQARLDAIWAREKPATTR